MLPLPSVGAMGFYSQISFDSSLGHAQRFAGPDGHVATLPEIVSARLRYPDNSFLWDNWFTTASVEGLDFSGAVVVHDAALGRDVPRIEAAYAKGRPDGQAALDAEILQELRGTPGAMFIEFRTLRRSYAKAKRRSLNVYEADQDTLAQARLGPDGARLLTHLQHQAATRTIAILESISPHSVFRKEERLRITPLPVGHLLEIGMLEYLPSSGELGFWVGPHQGTEEKYCIGVRPGADLSQVHSGPHVLVNYPELMMVRVTHEVVPSFSTLLSTRSGWYTQYPRHRRGQGYDSGWPMFAVNALEVLTDPCVFSHIDTQGEYDVDHVVRLAPPNANAYYLDEEGRVTYCYVRVDEEYMVQPYEEMVQNFPRLMELLDQAARL